jgi:DNA-binding transcriptional LysR family regulator
MCRPGLTQLEDSLGVSLFLRSGRKLQITSEGARLLAYADRLLQLADEAQAAVQPDQKPSGQLRIGSMETTAAARLPQVLAAFNRKHPEVDLILDTAPTDHLLDGVLKHRLDLALVAGTGDSSRAGAASGVRGGAGADHQPRACAGRIADRAATPQLAGVSQRLYLQAPPGIMVRGR